MKNNENKSDKIPNKTEKREIIFSDDNIYYYEAIESIKNAPIGSIPPALIDFNADSYYTCNPQSQRRELQTIINDINNRGANIKTEIKDYEQLDQEISKLELSVNSIFRHETILKKKAFDAWSELKDQSCTKILKKTFFLWNRLIKYQQMCRKNTENLKREVFKSLQKNAIYQREKYRFKLCLMKRTFLLWDRKLDIALSEKIFEEENGKRIKKKYFKKLKNKKAIYKRRRMVKEVEEAKCSAYFGKWRETILNKKYRSKVNKLNMAIFFNLWKKNLKIKEEIKEREMKLNLVADKFIEDHKIRHKAPYFNRLCYRYGKSLKEKKERSIKNWDKITTNLINYYYCRRKLIKLSEQKFFNRIREIKQRQDSIYISYFLARWYEYVSSKKKFRALVEERKKLLLYRTMGKWYLKWRYVDDMKNIILFRQEVLYKRKIMNAFYQWRIKYQQCVNEKIKKYVEFRCMKLESKSFRALRRYVDIKQYKRQRREEKNNLRTVGVIFNTLHSYVVFKNQKAQDFYNFNLKKRMLNNFMQLLKKNAVLKDSRKKPLRARIFDDSFELINIFNAEKLITDIGAL